MQQDHSAAVNEGGDPGFGGDVAVGQGLVHVEAADGLAPADVVQ
jgi:hypothetical protein